MSDTIVADSGMQAKRAWVRRVLKIDVGEGSGHAPIDAGDIRDRLNEIGLKIRELAALPEAADIRKRFAQAAQALKTGMLRDTLAILDEIEPMLIEFLSMARGKEAGRVIRSAKAWRGAVARINATLTGFKTSVISMLQAEDHEPEEIDDVGAQLDAEIADIAGKLSEGLADQVDAVINGDPARREAGMKTITARIQAVEDQIVNHEGVDAIEDNGAIPIKVREPVRAALDELRAALDEAAGQASKVAA